MLLTLVIFIFILGLLIFVHEFGHFISAKRIGAEVQEFGFGFPPRILGIKRGETLYSLNLFPVGGFVKILGEGGEEKNNPRSFASKTILKRGVILVSGVVMNLGLAVVLLSVGYGIGLPTVIEDEVDATGRDIGIQIMGVAENSPADEAGLRIGDTIRKVGGKSISDIKEVQEIINAHKGKEITLIIERGKEVLEKMVKPREHPPQGEGAIGIMMVKTGIVSYPWYQAFWRGIESTFALIGTSVVLLGGVIKDLVLTGTFRGQLAGPVGIAVLTGQAAKLGFIYLLQFTALLSINLAIINAFPFPALDGGRLLFLAIEKIKGSPVSQKVEKTIHNIGFVLLILLMILITFRDVVKLF